MERRENFLTRCQNCKRHTTKKFAFAHNMLCRNCFEARKTRIISAIIKRFPLPEVPAVIIVDRLRKAAK